MDPPPRPERAALGGYSVMLDAEAAVVGIDEHGVEARGRSALTGGL
jgi:hypothetical protein